MRNIVEINDFVFEKGKYLFFGYLLLNCNELANLSVLEAENV